MSLQWPLFPLFLLSAAMVAWARWPRTASRRACLAFAGLFFGLGVLGLGVEADPAAAVGTGILYMLLGLPLASVTLALAGLGGGAAPERRGAFPASERMYAR